MYRLFVLSVSLCFGSAAAFAASDPGLLALIPADSKVVSSVNVQQAWNSPFGQFLLNKTNSDTSGFDKVLEETGFDPRRDLQSFVFASRGPEGSKAQSTFVIVARGNFQSPLIRTRALAHGATVQTVEGVDIYSGNDHGPQTGFAFPDTGIAVFGDLASVKQVIANRANPSVLDSNLQSLINKASGNDAWFASILPGAYLTRHLNDATNQQAKPQALALQSVRQAAGGVQFSDPVQLSFDAMTRSPQDAVSLADVVRFMVGFLQMQRQNNPQTDMLASALDTMVLNASGNTFHAGLAVPEKTLEQLINSGMTSGSHSRANRRQSLQ
jgi:hypothetical protein